MNKKLKDGSLCDIPLSDILVNPALNSRGEVDVPSRDVTSALI